MVTSPTTGIRDQKFELHGHTFNVFDVRGQKNERSKWIHCFETVSAVLFITSLSVYDATLYEDDIRNRMQDALLLFSELVNAKRFRLPIEDAIYGTSILFTTLVVLLSISLSGVYSEIQSWMIAHAAWCIFVVLYLFNEACTVYSIFSDRENSC